MSENFMTAGTQIGELLVKREQILAKAANLISAVLISKANNDSVTDNTKNDIQAIIRGFSVEEQRDILLMVVVKLTMNKPVQQETQPKRNKQKNKKIDPENRASLWQ